MQVSVHTDAPLQYILVEPVTAGGPARQAADGGDGLPLVVCLHGRGSSADDLAGLAQALDRERYRYVVPNAPMVLDLGFWCQGYMWYELGAQQFEGIAYSRGLIEQLLALIAARYRTPRSRTVLLGFSQGAVMSMDVGLRSPEPFAAMVVLSGYLALDDSLSEAVSHAQDRRLLVVHGTEDQVVGIGAARSSVQALRDFGLDPAYKEYFMGHEVAADELELIREFLAETFGGSGPNRAPGC